MTEWKWATGLSQFGALYYNLVNDFSLTQCVICNAIGDCPLELDPYNTWGDYCLMDK